MVFALTPTGTISYMSERVEDSEQDGSGTDASIPLHELEDAETLAIRRHQTGQINGSTTMEEFVREMGLSEDEI